MPSTIFEGQSDLPGPKAKGFAWAPRASTAIKQPTTIKAFILSGGWFGKLKLRENKGKI